MFYLHFDEPQFFSIDFNFQSDTGTIGNMTFYDDFLMTTNQNVIISFYFVMISTG
jgi:hypothetical protein